MHAQFGSQLRVDTPLHPLISSHAQRHPEGIVSVAFKEFEAADECVEKMNQRWYAKRQLEVTQWDGITNFQVEETDQERDNRLKKWETFLKEDDEHVKERKDSGAQEVS